MVDILHNIGSTPLARLNCFSFQSNIYAKLEYLNPSGSLKDRIAHEMIHLAEKRGELKKGMRIMEATSGNTGISFAMVSAALGYEFTAIMPENVTKERRQMIGAFGGKVMLTPAKEEMFGPVKRLAEMKKRASEGKLKNVWFPSQFQNQDNPKSHLKTGQELAAQLKKISKNADIDAFVMGVGTGGTLMGAGSFLKKKFKDVKIVAVEPSESPVLSGGKPRHHEIQGIGEGFVPPIFNYDIVDEIIRVKSKDSIVAAREVAKKEGLLCGPSSGANILACLELQQRREFRNKNILTILCDRGERYLSTGIWK